MYPLPVSFILHYIENGKIWVYSRKKLKGPWRSSSHSKENCVSTAEGSGLGESSPISTNESPLDMLGWRVTVLGQRIMFYSIAGLMLSLLFCIGIFPGTLWYQPRDMSPPSRILQHREQNVLELIVHILFIHAPKSKPNASKEKKMKEKRTVKGGERRVIDWLTLQVLCSRAPKVQTSLWLKAIDLALKLFLCMQSTGRLFL